MDNIYLNFKKLIIIGVNRNYTCDFKPGLNLIWGDLDSGKSSILNLIDFSLGGKFGDLDNDQIKGYGRTVCLEVELNNTTITLQRILGDNQNTIKLYESSFENINEHYPAICSASPSKEEPDGWISDKLLDYLNIPKVQIKESRYRDNARNSRLSFRDLIKLIHLKQKRVASENLMDLTVGAVFNRNVEVQKFVYGVHDNQISELNQQLTTESRMLSDIEKQTSTINNFLKATKSFGCSQDEYENINNHIEQANSEIEMLKSDEKIASIVTSNIKNELELVRKKTYLLQRSISNNKLKLGDYLKLKSSYEKDLSCLNSSISMRSTLTVKELELRKVSCPTCNSYINLSSNTLSDEDLNSEVKSIKNRIAGCKSAIEKIKNTIKEDEDELAGSNAVFNNIRENFDKSNMELLSPTIEAISKAEAAKQLLVGKIAEIKKNKMLGSKLDEMYSMIDNKKISIEKIKRDIKTVEERLGNIDKTIESLSNHYHRLMKDSKLTNFYGAKIDDKFMPTFRDRAYTKMSSGGVRTLMSVNLYISRLNYLMDNGGYLPTTLLLDTPGQNIGRYVREGITEDNLSDPSIYEQIYQSLKDLKIKSKGNHYQIIVVDNDLANCLNEGDYHLVKRFDKTEQYGDKGLISDAVILHT
ncbi:hypothetical protein ACRWQM_13575 [Shewanella sp. HL-SH5]|uniref:hypothetical protein n=1 Tax=Shewanella sp. HL-SH5 TaxID=3436241 RepID=UPI003EBBE2A2